MKIVGHYDVYFDLDERAISSELIPSGGPDMETTVEPEYLEKRNAWKLEGTEGETMYLNADTLVSLWWKPEWITPEEYNNRFENQE